MRRDLPTPDAILEELADKVAAQIDRLAPVAFDGAFRELIRYHKFLLALNASRTPDGATFNYAEVAGNAWYAPHREWIRQYRRLFERAASRLPDDGQFIRLLAYAPQRLLPSKGDPALPANIVRVILDLGPMLMHRVEDWVTKRTSLDTPKGVAAAPRLTLAGSDAKAYANVLPDLVGAWEGLLHQAPTIYNWPENSGHDVDATWSALQVSWPFLWQHLSNTAHCLAVAVWNEDEAGAALFREALVRWPGPLQHRLEEHGEFRHHRLLFPSILELDWKKAVQRAAPLMHDFMSPPTPERVFTCVVRGAHNDAVLLTAALLLFWTINDKQASDIGGRTAQALLRRERDEANNSGSAERNLSFRSLLLDFMRHEVAGERYRDGSYSATLDQLVATLDNMTERRVVPLRVFTPSTLNGRGDLLLAVLAILVAAVPDMNDDGVGLRIAQFAADEKLLPEGDRSLRDMVFELRRYRTSLEQEWPQITRGVGILAPKRNVKALSRRLSEIAQAAESEIEAKRLERLKAHSVDANKIERIRSAIEAALLGEPAQVPFFRRVEVVRLCGEEGDVRDITFGGIQKAHLLEPPMDSVSTSFDEMFVTGSQEAAGQHAWGGFTQRPRTTVDVSGTAEHDTFWSGIAGLIPQVGPEPVLVVSRAAEGRALQRFLYSRPEERPDLTIERHDGGERGASYIATVEGVDVLGADFPAGVAWLFSARALRQIGYAEVDSGRHVTVEFDPKEELIGTLRVRVRQRLEWTQTPIFELRAPDPDREGD
jgi:hypothetical protein